MKFQKAIKERLKARVALEGPTGAGKTWTALEWATVLADGGDVAVIDTEHRSASYYADKYNFDTLHWPAPYDPVQLAKTVNDAGSDYAVIVIDSLTHFWNGEGGTLDMVDNYAQRNKGNQFGGWKTATPAFRYLIDSVLASPCHVVCTMRSKMEHVQEKKGDRTVIRKVGMAPEMRNGIEYEFTVVGELDTDHHLAITKSRCDLIADKVAQPHRAGELAQVFAGWLDTGAEPVEPPATAPARPVREPAAAADDRLAVTYTVAAPRGEVPAIVADDEAQQLALNGGGGKSSMTASQRFAVDLAVKDDVRHGLYRIVTGRDDARYGNLTTKQRNQVVRFARDYVNGASLDQIEHDFIQAG